MSTGTHIATLKNLTYLVPSTVHLCSIDIWDCHVTQPVGRGYIVSVASCFPGVPSFWDLLSCCLYGGGPFCSTHALFFFKRSDVNEFEIKVSLTFNVRPQTYHCTGLSASVHMFSRFFFSHSNYVGAKNYTHL